MKLGLSLSSWRGGLDSKEAARHKWQVKKFYSLKEFQGGPTRFRRAQEKERGGMFTEEWDCLQGRGPRHPREAIFWKGEASLWRRKCLDLEQTLERNQHEYNQTLRNERKKVKGSKQALKKLKVAEEKLRKLQSQWEKTLEETRRQVQIETADTLSWLLLDEDLNFKKNFHEILETYKRSPKGSPKGSPRTKAEIRRERCIYCGGKGGTLDHLIPKSLGGTTYVAACRACNLAKGAKRPSEFPPLQKWKVAHPQAWETAVQKAKDPQAVRDWLKY